MSHVVTIETQILDLASLRKAAEELGLEFVEGQRTYRWFGRFMADSPIPEGFTPDDYGKCQHALRVKGDTTAYEVGVVRRKDGAPGFQLIYDFYGSCGKALEAVAGKGLTKLRQEYAAQVVIRQMGGKHKIKRTTQADGSIRLHLTGA